MLTVTTSPGAYCALFSTSFTCPGVTAIAVVLVGFGVEPVVVVGAGVVLPGVPVALLVVWD